MAAMALRSLARKVMPVPATLRRAPPPSRSLYRHSLEGTTSPKTTTPTSKSWEEKNPELLAELDKLRGKASPETTAPIGSTFEERNPELYAELVKRFSDQTRYNRRMRLVGASAYGVVLVTLLYLRNREKYLFEKYYGDDN